MSNSLQPHGLYSPWNSPGQNTKVGGLSLLQGVFPTQGPNPGPPHCRQILYQLNHKRSPSIPEWITYRSSSRSFPINLPNSDPGIEPGSPALHVDSLPTRLLGSNYWKAAIWYRWPSQTLCGDQEGWKEERRKVRRGGDMYRVMAGSRCFTARTKTTL